MINEIEIVVCDKCDTVMQNGGEIYTCLGCGNYMHLEKFVRASKVEVAFEEIQRVFKKHQEADEPNTKAFLFKVVKIANEYLGGAIK